MTFLKSTRRMKMVVLGGVWEPIVGPLSPERQQIVTKWKMKAYLRNIGRPK
jgi:hypothetical protein